MLAPPFARQIHARRVEIVGWGDDDDRHAPAKRLQGNDVEALIKCAGADPDYVGPLRTLLFVSFYRLNCMFDAVPYENAGVDQQRGIYLHSIN